MQPESRFRYERLDALRGAAMVWMAAFHLCFDLSFYGVLKQNFYTDPFWLRQRVCIVSLFLLCAGVGQAVALHQGQGWPRFWRRWGQVALCAALVSAGSALMFPRSWISFGVLHGMAVMFVLMRLAAPAGRWLWALGLVAIALPWVVQHPFFDTRLTNWVGLVTHKPRMEDYVPVLPWIGVMAFGVAMGQWLLRARPAWLQGPLPGGFKPLVLLGRWPLTFYMLHQPVFIGLIVAVRWMVGAG